MNHGFKEGDFVVYTGLSPKYYQWEKVGRRGVVHKVDQSIVYVRWTPDHVQGVYPDNIKKECKYGTGWI